MNYDNLNKELISYISILNKFFNEEHISLSDSFGEYLILSIDNKCQFILNMHHGGRYSKRIVFNLRYRKSDEMIFRLEIDGKPHVNLDGTITDRDHVHILLVKDDIIYNYGISLSEFRDIIIKNTEGTSEVFEAVCNYNKITIPEYQKIM